jgi:signal transduction histidine kinase
VTRVRLAWALAALCLVCAVTDTVLTLDSRPFFSEAAVAKHGWPFVTLATVACAAMGALIVSRYPRHPIGWLLTATGVTGAVSLVTEAWSIWILRADGPGSEYFGHAIGWFSALVGAPLAITFLAFVFLTAPDGHLLSPRWRWVGRAIVLGLLGYTAGVLTVPPGDVTVDENQEFGALPSLLTSLGVLLLALGLIAGVVSLVRRLRRSEGELRLQLRWITAAAAAIPFGLVWLIVVQGMRGGEQTWVDSTPLFLSYLALPIAVAIAVLRHRLYDIDLIISRAALLAVATAFVAVGYVTMVVVVGGNAGGFWPSLLATAVVALAFQPLRTRAVRLADRLAFGQRAVPYEALAEFSRRLGESPDPATLLPAVADTAAHAVHARRVTAELFLTGCPHEAATWGADDARGDSSTTAGTTGADVLEMPVSDRGEQLGRLTVTMPPGRTLRARDTDLLTAIADQAAIAFRNAQLSAELAGRVEQLRAQTLDLVESRRRLITVGDSERRRLERAIATDVVPHLEPLPHELAHLARSWQGGSPDHLEPLVAASGVALEALREITRGVFPAQLVRGGLGAALRSYLGRTESEGRLDLHESAAERRFDPVVEAAAYFCVTEAAQGLEMPVEVAAAAPNGQLELRVRGRSRGVLALAHIRDRVEAAGGTVRCETVNERTVLDVRLPATAADQPDVRPAAVQATP